MAFGITQLAGDRLMDFQGCPWTAVVRRRADAGSASFLEILRPEVTDLPLGFGLSAARRVRVSGTRHKLGLGFQIGGKFFKPDRVVGQLLPHRDITLSGRKPSQLQRPMSIKPRGVHDRLTGSTRIVCLFNFGLMRRHYFKPRHSPPLATRIRGQAEVLKTQTHL